MQIAKDAYDMGAPAAALKHGLSRGSVFEIAAEQGFMLMYRHEAQCLPALPDLCNGMTIVDASAKHGVPYGTLRKWIARWKKAGKIFRVGMRYMSPEQKAAYDAEQAEKANRPRGANGRKRRDGMRKFLEAQDELKPC
jgi:hypothetical protein